MSKADTPAAEIDRLVSVASRGFILAGILTAAAAHGSATNAPRQWVDEALHGADEQLHPVIKNHIRSQLDWRSYYLDRATSRRPPGPAIGLQEPPRTGASDESSRSSASQT